MMTSFEFKFGKTDAPQGSRVLARRKPAPSKAPVAPHKTAAAPLVLKALENATAAPTADGGGFIRRKAKKSKLKGEVPAASSSKSHSLFSEKYKNVHINTDVKGVSVAERVFSSGGDFGALDLHRHLQSNLEKHGFTVLTTVQEKAIPVVLSGKNCLIRSQTGSGKTLTYAVPILDQLVRRTPKLQRSDGVQAIVVVPTRELAQQTHELISKLNWIVTGQISGGENRKTEKDKLRRGVHILVGTPGRLLDHILHTAAFNAKSVNCLVLDEADRLLDMGFKKDIVRLVEELNSQRAADGYDPLALLKGVKTEGAQSPRQTLLLSATLTKDLAELADFTMKDHVYIDALDDSFTLNPQHMVIPQTVKQEFVVTFIKHRLVMLAATLISKAQHTGKTIVFMATTQMVEFHHQLFSKYLLNMPVVRGQPDFDSDDEEPALDVELFKLHGNMDQKERKEVFNGFRAATKGILICTDVVARGIDVPAADCIVQYTGPQSDDDYLHRVGRTGRAGKSGSALLFLTHEEQDYISTLQAHKVFLREHNVDFILSKLMDFMDEPNKEMAISKLQKRFEQAIAQDDELHKKACSGKDSESHSEAEFHADIVAAYSSWSRFYSSFPGKMKTMFDLRNVNIGHYVTSFGLQESPTAVSRMAKQQAVRVPVKRLNQKLANHRQVGN
ncbi:hypothetical protein D910_05684 [Dendroctonus ponderosae]|uniref:ATP-dependent RNA helicase n=2 Tax=Dendroctonus ponderosae TaxID=77166 RepID=U4U5F4_DENPD|nr:hypothetical protein D910_05684 [Dendroctonus ponderosae]